LQQIDEVLAEKGNQSVAFREAQEVADCDAAGALILGPLDPLRKVRAAKDIGSRIAVEVRDAVGEDREAVEGG
jgi:hypothetical protein